MCKINCNWLNIKYIHAANLRQYTANFGQIVTYSELHGIGYDLATELCLFLTSQCLFSPDTRNEKALQINEFVGLVVLLSPSV